MFFICTVICGFFGAFVSFYAFYVADFFCVRVLCLLWVFFMFVYLCVVVFVSM